MTLDDYAKHLGGLVGNFHSLEFSLRMFLNGLPGAKPIGVPPGADIYTFPVGDKLPESDLTSYDSLGRLVTRFNREMDAKGGQKIDDTSLVDLRDALAHGRVSAYAPDENLRLLKFSKPENGYVSVLFNEKMTEEWFSKQKKMVYEAIMIVKAQIEP